MSGEKGEEPPTPVVVPAKPAPIAPTHHVGRELKVKIWVGVLLALGGTYLLGDPEARLRLAWDVVTVWWPLVLLALAVANVLRSLFQLESLLAPGLLAFVALVGLAIQRGITMTTLADVAVPAVIALSGVGLLLSVGSRMSGSWTRILVTGQVATCEQSQDVIRPRVFLGELKADLSLLAVPPEELQVTAIFGHVRLTIPAEWRLNLFAKGALATPIRGIIGLGPPEVRLRVLGFCGVVSVVRALDANPARPDGRLA